MFVGCCSVTKGYRIWIPTKRRVEISGNVIVDENSQATEVMQDIIATPFDSNFFPEQISAETTSIDNMETAQGEITTTTESSYNEESTTVSDEIPENPESDTQTNLNINRITVNDAEVRQTEPSIDNLIPESSAAPQMTPRKSSRNPVFNEKFLEWKQSLEKVEKATRTCRQVWKQCRS